MRALVMDGLAALGFLMTDEQAPAARRAIEAMERGTPTVVPSHWPLEVANGLLMAERRKRITRADAAEAIDVLGQLPIDTDAETGRRAWAEASGLARQYRSHGLRCGLPRTGAAPRRCAGHRRCRAGESRPERRPAGALTAPSPHVKQRGSQACLYCRRVCATGRLEACPAAGACLRPRNRRLPRNGSAYCRLSS